MFRKIKEEDKEVYFEMSTIFYNSDAVSHNIPKDNFVKTFNMMMENSPFVDAYIIYDESNNEVAGYGLLSIGYSNEVGHMEIWLEEIYVLDKFRGKGYGTKFMEFVEKEYSQVGRLRLEVARTNEKAIELYKRLGYEEIPYYQMMKYIKD